MSVREGFEQATSANLPSISMFAVGSFMNQHVDMHSVETQGVKLDRSAKALYGDQCVGYVELQRQRSIVTLHARITPEHKVRAKPYNVKVTVDEELDKVLEGKCFDCAASKGGCKHLVAFLFWIHRRCEEPSPTEVACYWKRSSLSTVGEKKCMSLKEFCGDKYPTCEGPSQTNELYNAFRDKCLEKGIENMITSMNPNDNPSMSLHILKIDFLKINSVQSDANKFIKFCSDSMTVELCQEIEKLTRGQSLSKLWFNLRYGRITASKAYDAAHCNTEDGSLVNQILGAKLFLTEPMKRGMRLEEEVLREIGIQLNCAPKKCGLFLSPKFPLFGATPDGIGNGFLIEVKCPSSQKAMASYIFTDGSIKPKYYTQVQLQMLLCGFNKCVFVVAHPDFETSRNITKIWATLDNCYVSQIVNKCTQFWEKYIYKFI